MEDKTLNHSSPYVEKRGTGSSGKLDWLWRPTSAGQWAGCLIITNIAKTLARRPRDAAWTPECKRENKCGDQEHLFEGHRWASPPLFLTPPTLCSILMINNHVFYFPCDAQSSSVWQPSLKLRQPWQQVVHGIYSVESFKAVCNIGGGRLGKSVHRVGYVDAMYCTFINSRPDRMAI